MRVHGVLGERVDDMVAGRANRVRRVDEHLVGVADAAAHGQPNRQPVCRPQAARQLRRQRQPPAVVDRVLCLQLRIEVADVREDLPAIRHAAHDADRRTVDALCIVLVVERRNGRRVHGVDDVLVLRAEHGRVQRDASVGEVPLAADLVVGGLLRLDARIVLVVRLGAQREVRGAGRRDGRAIGRHRCCRRH